MKTWQKVEMSRGLGITLIMLVVVGITMFALGAIVSESRHEKRSGTEQNAQPQPTQPPTDAPKPPTADDPEKDEEPNPEIKKKGAANPPRNILGDIYDNTHSGMTVAELDAVVAKQALYKALERPYVKKQHMPPEKHPPNGMDVEIRVWTWEDSEDERGDRWVTELRVDIFDGVVAGRVYDWRQEVNRGSVWK